MLARVVVLFRRRKTGGTNAREQGRANRTNMLKLFWGTVRVLTSGFLLAKEAQSLGQQLVKVACDCFAVVLSFWRLALPARSASVSPATALPENSKTCSLCLSPARPGVPNKEA